MSKEEAIRNLEIYIKVTEKQIESGELFLYVETEKNHIDSIKKLLDLYNKEKEKNYNLTHVLFTGESDYISKDKINNLLKKYENEHFIAKVDLKSILEDNV